jgi:uncharacterized protein (DUF488 family)
MPARSPAERVIWTIGHSTRAADDFLELLTSNRITGLADVRTIPRSRRHPHFGGDVLAENLAAAGIQYRHFAALGGLRKPRSDSSNGAWRNAAFRGYADHMETPAFIDAVDDLLAFGTERRVAVMCAEAVWWQCHRMLLSDALVARGVDVRHIMSPRGASSVQPHRLTPFAKMREDGAVSYPGLV